jgi:chromosome segregation protein
VSPVYLKSLTLRGFKSFASTTRLRFEPGITCVVGPNGSGKSNVVDALAWVMGEQGAKSLRGGKMEDVIFAGTAGRPPLGRAEVSLTIDNTDGALPIDYSEVTISRTMFRSGGSEYAINGSAVRLLDVQELLSDSGIGREMHVIVGQGRLDAVLRATPEERRGFIEEAAGVLKHRKRKEKALRKLDAMQANLTRIADLTTEIRRQLGPLGRQADVARRAAGIQADARDAKARLLADDYVQLTSTIEQEVADETALLARRAEVEQSLADLRARLDELAADAENAAPRIRQAAATWVELTGLRERARGTASLATERVRLLGVADVEEAQVERPDPARLRDQAAAAREQEGTWSAQVAAHQQALATRVQARSTLESEHAEAERALAMLVRAAADRREGLARLAGQVSAKRSRVEAAEAEVGRLTASVAAADERGRVARSEFALLEQQVAGVEEGEESLDADHAAAEAAAQAAAAAVEELVAAERAGEHERATWSARREALELSLSAGDGAAVLLDGTVTGVLGQVAATVHVEGGFEDAIAAALGPVADAVAVQSLDVAVDAVRHLKTRDAGRAALLVGGAPAISRTSRDLPSGARSALDLVRSDPGLMPALTRLLETVVVVDDLACARTLVARDPELVVVTRDGDLLGAALAQGGSAEHSVLHVAAAVEEAAENAAAAAHRVEQARFALQAARRAAAEADADVAATLERLHDSDARFAAVAERLGQLGSAARAAKAEHDRLAASLRTAEEGLAADRCALADLQQRLAAATEAADDDEQPDTGERDRLAADLAAARAQETEARLAVRTAEERLSAIAGRAESLEGAALREQQARERAAARERQRRHQVRVATAVATGAAVLLTAIDRAVADAAAERDAAEAERADRDADIARLRTGIDALAAEHAQLTDAAHRDEMARAAQRLRIEQVAERALTDLGLTADTLVEEFGPHLLVAPSPPSPGDPEPEQPPQPVPYVRAEQEKRLRKAERGLVALGKVNPLAMEEFAALEERHRFLVEQLDDLRRSKADLLGIVADIDARVQQVFSEAFADTAREFEGVFARLFPGGEGRLVLTDPDDMLATGLDVEARPAGKKVKRLSLLSGGERSLTAVALLVAIFKARPSPFYVMDEVEAALDDVNLGRLIDIFAELRDSSQLIVITHQKRTMEGADALYGVTMRGDGVSTVISQRIDRE